MTLGRSGTCRRQAREGMSCTQVATSPGGDEAA